MMAIVVVSVLMRTMMVIIVCGVVMRTTGATAFASFGHTRSNALAYAAPASDAVFAVAHTSPLQLNLLQAVYGPSHPEVKFTLEGQMSKHNTKTLQSLHRYAAPLCFDVACRTDLSQAYSSLGDSAREQEYAPQPFVEARANCYVFLFCGSMSIARVLSS
jgi:hypothetical protein